MMPMVRLERLGIATEPTNVITAIALMIADVPGVGEGSILVTQLGNSLRESQQIGIGSGPIEPAERSVLTVGVIVAALAMTEFAASGEAFDQVTGSGRESRAGSSKEVPRDSHWSIRVGGFVGGQNYGKVTTPAERFQACPVAAWSGKSPF